MKNPTAKNYEGPKSYQKLIHNVPKLNSLSKKQLKNVSPFSKKLLATYQTHPSLESGRSSLTQRGRQIEYNQLDTPISNQNSGHPKAANTLHQGGAMVASYSLSHNAPSGKLESRQINEVVGRGLNIWRKSKKRLKDYYVESVTLDTNKHLSVPLSSIGVASDSPVGINQSKGSQIGDYWDVKRNSKNFSLS